MISVPLSTGSDSPVSAASSTCNRFDSITRISAATIPVVAASLFYDVPWSNWFTSTFGFSFQDRDLDGTALLPDAFKSGQYALANLIYYPVKELMTAVELQYGRRQNFSDGWDYDAWRIQFSVKYKFSFQLGNKP